MVLQECDILFLSLLRIKFLFQSLCIYNFFQPISKEVLQRF